MSSNFRVRRDIPFKVLEHKSIFWDDASFTKPYNVNLKGQFIGFITSVQKRAKYCLLEVQMLPGSLSRVFVPAQPVKPCEFKLFTKIDNISPEYHEPYQLFNISNPPEESKTMFNWRQVNHYVKEGECYIMVPIIFVSGKLNSPTESEATTETPETMSLACSKQGVPLTTCTLKAESSIGICLPEAKEEPVEEPYYHVAHSPWIGPVVVQNETLHYMKYLFYYVFVKRLSIDMKTMLGTTGTEWIARNSYQDSMKVMDLDIKQWMLPAVHAHDYGLVVWTDKRDVAIFVSERHYLIPGVMPGKKGSLMPGYWVRFNTCKHINGHLFALNPIKRNLPPAILASVYDKSSGLIMLSVATCSMNRDGTASFKAGPITHLAHNPDKIELNGRKPIIFYCPKANRFNIKQAAPQRKV
ncbi:unnamed protein product [Bursaphelenchus okinawaensis]|uniref:Uncharacterized protein n=1 Tax=Bursaphelenchus okinawaensis TaxID=465554 RepID=A0A811JU18_9BILA|nr:unnamed protein product [Bursaphelenchus okinawaensis]CAG9083008.1 unnamed protein product [Bursaphelenchus okinawaensis]